MSQDDRAASVEVEARLRGQLDRALNLLLRLRSGEPRTWPQLCRMQEEIDAFVAEVRGPR